MSTNNPLIWFPAGLALVFLIIGLSSSWRTFLGFLIAGYAAIVIASQHNAFFTAIAENYVNLSNTTTRQQSAITFGVTLTTLFLGIFILCRITWRPVTQQTYNASQQLESGWTKLLRGILNAAFGWMLGAVLLICILTFQPFRGNFASGSGTQAYTDAVYGTVDVTLDLAKPWIVSGIPIVFRGE